VDSTPVVDFAGVREGVSLDQLRQPGGFAASDQVTVRYDGMQLEIVIRTAVPISNRNAGDDQDVREVVRGRG
jgi:hypothetical protein